MNPPSNLSTGWPDALSKLGLAIMAVCALLTSILNGCAAQRQNKALQYRLGVDYIQESQTPTKGDVK